MKSYMRKHTFKQITKTVYVKYMWREIVLLIYVNYQRDSIVEMIDTCVCTH